MLSPLNSFAYTIYMATISKKKHLQACGMAEQSGSNTKYENEIFVITVSQCTCRI